jgi:hypothetical protein
MFGRQRFSAMTRIDFIASRIDSTHGILPVRGTRAPAVMAHASRNRSQGACKGTG